LTETILKVHTLLINRELVGTLFLYKNMLSGQRKCFQLFLDVTVYSDKLLKHPEDSITHENMKISNCIPPGAIMVVTIGSYELLKERTLVYSLICNINVKILA
jgi:hypothetical protein